MEIVASPDHGRGAVFSYVVPEYNLSNLSSGDHTVSTLPMSLSYYQVGMGLEPLG